MAKASVRDGHKQLTRARILEAAAAVFEREGFQAVSVESVSAEAQVSRPTFYQYFRNKTDVLAHLLAERAEKASLLFAARLAANPRPTPDDLRAWVEGFVNLYEANVETMQAWACAESDPASLHAIDVMQRRVTDVLTAYVASVRAEIGAPVSDAEARAAVCSSMRRSTGSATSGGSAVGSSIATTRSARSSRRSSPRCSGLRWGQPRPRGDAPVSVNRRASIHELEVPVGETKGQLRVGFVGVGDQGAPMAERILSHGWTLTVFARRPEVREHFAGLGASIAESLYELGERSDLVGVCVVDDAQVREVLLGDTVLSGMCEGGIVAIHSTVHPRTCRELAETAVAGGVQVLDAPVSGTGAAGARAGTLAVMVGGDAGAFERCRPVFETFATTVRHVGAVGSGEQLKLVNNYMLGVSFFSVYETRRVLQSLGVDLAAAAEILQVSSSSNWALQRVAATLFRDDATEANPHARGAAYALSVWQKDIRLFREMAGEEGVDIEAVDQAVSRAVAYRQQGI